MGLIGDYRRLMRAGIALARHDVILPGAYQTRLPLPARIAGRVLRVFGGGARGRPGERLARGDLRNFDVFDLTVNAQESA